MRSVKLQDHEGNKWIKPKLFYKDTNFIELTQVPVQLFTLVLVML
jgi:hypothetical protein